MGVSARTRGAASSPAPPSRSPTVASDCVVCLGEERQSTSKAASDVWVQCDKDDCRQWSHWDCVASSPDDQVDQIDKWYCQRCIDKSKRRGTPLEVTYKELPRKTSRKTTKIDYANLDAGLMGDPGRWVAIANSRPMKPHNFRRLKGEELNLDWVMSDPSAFLEPIIIESPDGLDMTMPNPSMTVRKVAEVVGTETPVEVMDVASQNGLAGWTLGRWAEYFHDPERSKIRNVISLEVSDTPLSKQVIPPKLVRDIDWIESVWPPEYKAARYYPKVQKYCLMSVANCWTDWHIDFAASSVYYHILSGGKTFFFIRPTAENLHKYEKWSGNSSKQEQEWLGDSVDAVYRVDLVAGNTMIIPSGWIHAVYTPSDALVFGGNFLHSLNIGTQLRVHEIEKKTKVPMKYRFPHFVTMLWFVADHYLPKLEASVALPKLEAEASDPPAKSSLHPDLTPRILAGLKFLSLFLLDQAGRFDPANKVATADEKRIAKGNLPEVITDPIGTAKRFRATVLACLSEEEPPPAQAQLFTANGVPMIAKKRKASSPVVTAAAGAKFKNFEAAPASKRARVDQTSEVTERREPVTTEGKATLARPVPDGVEDGDGPEEEVEVKTLTSETRVTRVVRNANGKVVRERRTVTTVVERMVWEPTMAPSTEVEASSAAATTGSALAPRVVSPAASAPSRSTPMQDVRPASSIPSAAASPMPWRNDLATSVPHANGTGYRALPAPQRPGNAAPLPVVHQPVAPSRPPVPAQQHHTPPRQSLPYPHPAPILYQPLPPMSAQPPATYDHARYGPPIAPMAYASAPPPLPYHGYPQPPGKLSNGHAPSLPSPGPSLPYGILAPQSMYALPNGKSS